MWICLSLSQISMGISSSQACLSASSVGCWSSLLSEMWNTFLSQAGKLLTKLQSGPSSSGNGALPVKPEEGDIFRRGSAEEADGARVDDEGTPLPTPPVWLMASSSTLRKRWWNNDLYSGRTHSSTSSGTKKSLSRGWCLLWKLFLRRDLPAPGGLGTIMLAGFMSQTELFLNRPLSTFIVWKKKDVWIFSK